MKRDELNRIIENHGKWLLGEGGERADLRRAYLRYADLTGADLTGADLRVADLRGANLLGADLRVADLDHSSGIPLHCGGVGIKLDERLQKQMCYHALINSPDFPGLTAEQRKWLNGFHRVESGDVEPFAEGA